MKRGPGRTLSVKLRAAERGILDKIASAPSPYMLRRLLHQRASLFCYDLKRDCPLAEPIQIPDIGRHRLLCLVDADAEPHGIERRHDQNRQPSGDEQTTHDG